MLDDTPLQPVMGISNIRHDLEETVIYEMLSWRPSGVIVAGLEHSDAARAMLANAGIPVVEVMDVDGDPVAAVVGIVTSRPGSRWRARSSRAAIARIAVRSSIRGSPGAESGEGFEPGLAEAGLRLADREFYSGGSALLKGREMTQAILARSPIWISCIIPMT